MNYQECQLIVDSTEDIFTGTNYAIDYYLDGEPYFTLDKEIIDADELPEDIKTKVNQVLDTLNIEY